MSTTIRVRSSEGATVRVEFSPNETIGDLKNKITSAFKIDFPYQILFGYPPAACNLPDDALIQLHISANDSLRVHRLPPLEGTEVIPVKGKKQIRSSKKATPVKSSPGSKNSVGATNSGSQVSSSSSSSYSRSTDKNNKPTFGSRIQTLSGPIATTSQKISNTARRLVPFSSASKQKIPRRRAGAKNVSSGDGKEDICSALMSAAEGGSGGRSKALRSVFRSAVAHQYDDSCAIARLRAAFAGTFTIEQCQNDRILGTGASSKISVTFPARPESARSKMHTEIVDLLSVEMLRAVLLTALEDDEGGQGAREFLKPVNMSKASPRIFWSLVQAFGSDLPHALSLLFPEVEDWSWLSDRKRQLSERAAINEQQLKASQAAASSRKRARELKKGGTSATPSQSDSAASSSSATAASLTADASIGDLRGVNDSTVVAALRELPGVSAFVPEHCVKPLLELLGGDSALLLANLDFEEACCIQKLNRLLETHSSSSSVQAISSDAVESWVASAQDTVVRSVMKCLLGSSRRLHKALQALGVHSPSNLRVWRLMPEVLFQKLLEEDASLQSIVLLRIRSGGEQQQQIATGEIFSIEWVKWMCGVCEHMREAPSVAWIDHFACDIDEEEEEIEDDCVDDDTGADADGNGGWVAVSDGSNFVGTSVRCYSLSDDYWDEGWVTHYLPPDDEEPSLWRVRGFRTGEITPSTVDRSNGRCTVEGKDRWTMDLDQDQLTGAIALYAAAVS